MKTRFSTIHRVLHLLAFTFLLAGAAPAQAANSAAIDEVLKLKSAGVADDTIVAFVQSKNQNFELGAEDILALRDRGLPTTVLNAMLSSGKMSAPSRPAPQQPPAPSPAPPAAPPTQAYPPGPSSPPAQPGAPAPSAPPSQPPSAPVPVAYPTTVGLPAGASADMAYFYQELSPYGRWVLGEDRQWYWQPAVALSTPSWRPYWDNGHWLYTNDGWYWSSDYPWGWAAFHYGRWNLHPHFGWVWAPDRVWAPAWVVWRSGGDYCGWAPLPPGAYWDSPGGRFLYHGRRVEVGFGFGLDWMHFSFCYTRELGEHHRWRPGNEVEIRSVFGRTAFLREMHGGERHEGYFNRGIEPSHVGQMRGRAVETVRIQDLHSPTGHGGRERYSDDRRTLEVYRPQFGGGRERGGGRDRR